MTSGPEAGYSPAAAARYADYWYNKYNNVYQKLSGDDCTNFVSQAFYAGGWDMDALYTYDDHHWWYSLPGTSYPAHWSPPWASAQGLKNYLSYGHGTFKGTYGPSHAYDSYTPAGVVTGDVVFYRWTGGSTEKHAALQVGLGNTSDGRYGNYVDAHTSPRYHAIWSLWPWNSQVSSTYYDFWHIG